MRRFITVTILALGLIAAGCSSSTNGAIQPPGSSVGSELPPSEPVAEETSSAQVVQRQEFTGTGDDIVDVDLDFFAVVGFTCSACDGNTVLESDGDGLLVNSIGPYAGSHFINMKDTDYTTSFEITADSAWKLVIDDVSVVPSSANSLSGDGDQAVFVSGSGDRAQITNMGEGNFVIRSISATGINLDVNEIGSYRGTVRLDLPAFVQVISEGDWEIEAT